MRQHLRVIAFDTKEFPLPCPTCRAPLEPAQCFDFVVNTEVSANEQGPAVSPRDLHAALNALVIEKGLMDNVRYCANNACRTPFEWVDSRVEEDAHRFRVCCAVCGQATCVQCRTSWHEQMTCEENRRADPANNNILSLAERRGWKACPSCRHLIEKHQGDCAYVVCRCGCGFCHTCGKAYKSSRPTFANAHGIPDCTCSLFVEDEMVQFFPPHAPHVPIFNRAANDGGRGLAVIIESDDEEIENDEIIHRHRVESDIDDGSDDAHGVRNDDRAGDEHELPFVPFNFPIILSDSESGTNENNFDGQATPVGSDDADSEDVLEGLIRGFGTVLGELAANNNYPTNNDSDGSDAALPDNGNFFPGNADSDTSQEDHFHQNNEPHSVSEDDLPPGVDLEDHGFGTDDPEYLMHPVVDELVPDFGLLGVTSAFYRSDDSCDGSASERTQDDLEDLPPLDGSGNFVHHDVDSSYDHSVDGDGTRDPFDGGLGDSDDNGNDFGDGHSDGYGDGYDNVYDNDHDDGFDFNDEFDNDDYSDDDYGYGDDDYGYDSE